MAKLKATFEAAVANSKKLTEKPDNATRCNACAVTWPPRRWTHRGPCGSFT